MPYTNAFPALIDNSLKERMTTMFEKVIDFLKPDFGQVWAEWIYDDINDELYIIEMAIRGAGAEVTTKIIPNAYGVDTECNLIADAMNEKHPSFFDTKLDTKSAAFYSFLLPEGKIQSIDGIDDILSLKGVVFADLKEMHVGDIVEKYKDKTSRYGTIVVKGNTRNDIEIVRKELMATIRIEVQTNNGIEEAIWE